MCDQGVREREWDLELKRGGGKIRKGKRKLRRAYCSGQATSIGDTGKSKLSRFPWYKIL